MCYPFHPLRGPAHDGELGWGGWQARGLEGTYLKRPGAGGRTRGHYDPRALRAVGLLSFEATAEELSTQRRSPAGITGAVPALYYQLPSWQTAPGSARASLLSTEGRPSLPGGQMPPPQRMAHVL